MSSSDECVCREVVTDMSMAERSAVHKFATGSSRLTTSDEFEHEGSEPFNVGADAICRFGRACRLSLANRDGAAAL